MEGFWGFISIFLTIVVAPTCVPTYRDWIKNLFIWNRDRKRQAFQKEVRLFEKLKESNRELYTFLFSSLLIIAALLGALLIFRSTLISSGWGKGVVAADWVVGIIIYLFSVYRFGQLKQLQNYDKTISFLKQQIEKLEPKPKD